MTKTAERFIHEVTNAPAIMAQGYVYTSFDIGEGSGDAIFLELFDEDGGEKTIEFTHNTVTLSSDGQFFMLNGEVEVSILAVKNMNPTRGKLIFD